MRNLVWLLPVLYLVAACDTVQGNQLAGTATGAALGAAIAPPGSKTEGALIGATAGLIAGSIVTPMAPGMCLWQRSDGSQFTAPCQ